MDDSKPESTTEEILCHRCGNVVMPREDEPFVVKHGMTTCPDCLLFIEKNGTTSNIPWYLALAAGMKYEAIQRFRGSECVPHAKWKAVRRPVGRPRIQPTIAVFIYHKTTLSLLYNRKIKKKFPSS